MKPTASAFKRFVLCATATAVVSSSFVVDTEHESRRPADETERRDQYHLDASDTLYPLQHSNLDEREHLKDHNHENHEHHERNGEGVLISSATESTESTARTPCHPDLGVLSCSQTGEICKKSPLPSLLSTEGDGSELLWDWYCSDTSDGEKEPSLMQAIARNLGFTVENGWDGFPPSGEFYDICTYDKGYTYNYNSTVRYPSGWDRCACEYYNYELPDGESVIYNDVDYCHNVNKYYCANYYDKTAPNNPNAYDACLCSVYDGKPIPGQSDGFCTELPLR